MKPIPVSYPVSVDSLPVGVDALLQSEMGRTQIELKVDSFPFHAIPGALAEILL